MPRRRVAVSGWPLRRKVIVLLVCATAAPLAVTATVEFRNTSRETQRQAAEVLAARADEVAVQVEDLHESFRRASTRLALQPDVQDLCAHRGSATPARATAVLEGFLVADPRAHIAALFDSEGTAIAATHPRAVGRKFLHRRYVREALAGRAFISDLYVNDTDGLPLVAYATPVKSGAGATCAAVIFADAAALSTTIGQGNGRAGAGSAAVLFDHHGVRIADGRDPSLVFRPAGPLPFEDVHDFLADRRFGEHTRELLERPTGPPDLFERAREPAGRPGTFETTLANGERALAVSRRLRAVDWTLFYVVPVATLHASVRQLVLHTALANAIVMALALAVGLLFARQIHGPIAAITQAASALSQGDHSARVGLHGDGELERLAETFDAMADSLDADRTELERRIAARTEALQQQNLSLAARTAELQERQEREKCFGGTLAALAAAGPLARVVETALLRVQDYLGSLVSICYRREGDTLVPVAAVGAGRETANTSVPCSGWMARALRARTATTLELPADAELRFDAGLATGRPTHLSLVPLVIGDREIGLLATGSARPLSQISLSCLSELALPLALTIARHALTEQTHRDALEIAQRNAELREQARELVARGEALQAQQRELEAKNREVEKANQMKTEFLANMSHELRTPLNAIIGFSELMLDEPGQLTPEHREFVKDVLTSGRHLLSLINSVLDLAKIEAGHVALALESVDPLEQIALARALVDSIAQQKETQIELGPTSERRVRADREKLQQILINLLSNALKFSPAHSRISIGASDSGSSVRFWVRDNGPGMPEEVVRELFKPFYQGEGSLSRRHSGTGLGLAISKRLVQHHGGEIGVETSVGAGATFWFTIPAAPERGPSPPEIRGVPVPDGTRPLVLVVEDDLASARLLRFHLEAAGYAVEHAAREDAAVEAMRRIRPAAVLLDLVLPEGGDGLRVLESLRSAPETRETPVIVVSVVKEPPRVRELGIAASFVKPINPSKVVAAVRRVVPAPPA